jgi:hypothetical protein
MRWKTQFLKLGPQTLYNFLGVVTFSTIEQTMHDFVGGITSTTIGIGIVLGIINFKHTCLSKFFVIDHSFYHTETIIFILTFP